MDKNSANRRKHNSRMKINRCINVVKMHFEEHIFGVDSFDKLFLWCVECFNNTELNHSGMQLFFGMRWATSQTWMFMFATLPDCFSHKQHWLLITAFVNFWLKNLKKLWKRLFVNVEQTSVTSFTASSLNTISS